MKELEIKDSKVQIDILDILDSLDANAKDELIQHLACENDVIKQVSEQLIYGYTEGGWHGVSGCDAADLSEPYDKYRREVAKMAGETAKSEIESLERDIKRFKKDNSNLSKYCWRIYHQFNLRTSPGAAIKGKMIEKWSHY